MIVANVDHDLDELVEAHRETWLREAEATVSALDPRAYSTGGSLHVLDFRALGAPEKGYLGFTADAELHEIAADFITPRPDAVPVAAVAVNVHAIASTMPEEAAGQVEAIGAAVAAVAAHELAHVVDAQATGRRLSSGATLEQVVRSLTDGRAADPARRSASHSAGWIRAYLHLVIRAAGLPHRDQWLRALVRDVAAAMPLPAETYLDALQGELLRHRRSDRLVEILRTPAPAGFLSLFDSRDAARSAMET
jgi:hypothetical protein